MEKDSTKPSAGVAASALFAGENWFDPLESAVRGRIRGFIEALLEEELAGGVGRPRHARAEPGGDVGSGASRSAAITSSLTIERAFQVVTLVIPVWCD